MAHFYGTLHGNRGEATRCGTPNSGITTQTASWSGAVRCTAYVDENTGEDYIRISFIQWHNGAGTNRTIYEGPISGGKVNNGK